MSTDFPTEGYIESTSSDQISWRSFSNNPSVTSPKFRLPNCKDGNVCCHLFVDSTLKKIGIKNVSQTWVQL